MSKIVEHPVISGVIASIIFAGLAAGYSKWSNRIDPKVEAKELSQEIKRRVASAESLLRNRCVPARDAIISAYGMLNRPDQDTPYKMGTFLKSDPKTTQKTLFDLSHGLFLHARDVNILDPYLEKKNVAKLRNAARTVTDNFNPVTLFSTDNQPEKLEKIRTRFRRLLITGFHSMFSNFEIRRAMNDYDVKQKRISPWMADILSTTETFDSSNEGYWWSACNEQVKLCYRLTSAEIRNLARSIPDQEKPIANLHMMTMFAHFIDRRNVPYDEEELENRRLNEEEKEAHRVLYRAEFEGCKSLFKTLYPSDIQLLVDTGLDTPRMVDG